MGIVVCDAVVYAQAAFKVLAWTDILVRIIWIFLLSKVLPYFDDVKSEGIPRILYQKKIELTFHVSQQ